MRTNFVLIDYENVQPKVLDALQGDHFHVIVFVGANQARIETKLARALMSLAPRADIVQISNSGKNALDFHIAYYVGKLAVEKPGSFFHIISNDTGFDPLLTHLKSQKIFGARSKSIDEMPIVKTTKSRTPYDKAVLVTERLKLNSKSRPTTRKGLLSSINSWFQKELTEDQLEAVLKALVKQNALVVDGAKVKYLLDD